MTQVNERCPIQGYSPDYNKNQVREAKDLEVGKIYTEYRIGKRGREYVRTFQVLEIKLMTKKDVKTGTFRVRLVRDDSRNIDKFAEETFYMPDKGITPYPSHGMWNATSFIILGERDF